MPIIYLPETQIKLKKDKAFQLECPSSSYSYAGMRFWISKSYAKLKQCGSLTYLEVNFPREGTVTLTRYISRYSKPETYQIEMPDLISMFSLIHDQTVRKVQFQYQASAADRQFEEEQYSIQGGLRQTTEGWK